MQDLSDIKIIVDDPAVQSGNLQSIVTEIYHALKKLLAKKNIHRIDLRAMPWTAGEEQQLEQILGVGEVKIEMNAMGKSIFQETSYSGVWWISHYNDEGDVISRLIEISYLPDMIFAQQEDIKSALERLKNNL